MLHNSSAPAEGVRGAYGILLRSVKHVGLRILGVFSPPPKASRYQHLSMVAKPGLDPLRGAAVRVSLCPVSHSAHLVTNSGRCP